MENMIKDRKIPLPNAFIKLGQSQYMEKYIMNGELRFSPAKVFTKMDEGKNKIADTHEGSLYYQISHLVAASIIGENSDGTPIYGKIFEIADSAFQRFTNETIQKIPFHCLYCYNYPPINAFVRLENYDNVVEEFPEYGIELWNRCLVIGHKNIRYHQHSNGYCPVRARTWYRCS